jgi:hypothetical protein
MLLRQFSSRQPYLLLAVPIVVLGVLFPAASRGLLSFAHADFPIEDVLSKVMPFAYYGVSIAAILIMVGALATNIVFNRHEFHMSPSYVPALVYAVVAVTLCLIRVSIPALAANVAVIIGLNRFLEVFRQNRALSEYFIAGFWIGAGALLFPPYLVLAAGLVISILNTRSFNWRELILPLLAFATPFVYWLVWKFWWNQLDSLVLFRKIYTFDPPKGPDWNDNYTRTYGIMIGVSFLLALRSFIFISDRSSNKARSVKRIFLLMSLFMLGSAGVCLILVGQWVPEVILLPVTFIMGHWYTNYRFSLIAPFSFYAILFGSAALILHVFGVF